MNPDIVDTSTASCPDATRAVRFRDSFEPADGVDYGWVEEYAKSQYEAAKKSFENLDAKASTLMNFAASGAGLFTFGSLAAIANQKLPVAVIYAMLIPIACAATAIVLAAFARWPRNVFPPPGPDQMIRLAQHYPGDAQRAKALMIPQWQWLTALMMIEVSNKAWFVAWATIAVTASVLSLFVPLAMSF